MKRGALRDRARELRRTNTQVEARIWEALRNRKLGGWKWKRQVPRGSYIVDFLCSEAKLVVELDGGQHAQQLAYDARRTAYLESLGYRVLRVWNHSVTEDASGVCDTILDACGGEAPLPASPRERGGE
jgi:very-short-patch-repair endonuclease